MMEKTEKDVNCYAEEARPRSRMKEVYRVYESCVGNQTDSVWQYDSYQGAERGVLGYLGHGVLEIRKVWIPR
jgi:hypothetical protein